MSKLARDLAIPSGGLATLNPRESIFAFGNMAAANAEVVIPADGAGYFAFDVRGTYVGTVIAEGSIDGTNWNTLFVRPMNAASVLYAATLVSATVGSFFGRTFGSRLIRIRMVAYTSGIATVYISQNGGAGDDSVQGLVTNSLVTATGAASAAVTLTIPSPGAGLRQYVTYLSINRFSAALLTAAAAPVVVTTTNLPGALAFSFGADAQAQGLIDRWREDFSYPLAASALATAITIVCPVTTNVIWRVTAGYYVAP